MAVSPCGSLRGEGFPGWLLHRSNTHPAFPKWAPHKQGHAGTEEPHDVLVAPRSEEGVGMDAGL